MKKVLVTGSTSFVGGATAARLLSSTDTEVVALVRARNDSEGERRVHASLARFGVSAPVLLRRLRVVQGGLSAPLDRAEVRDVTHVLDALPPAWSPPLASRQPTRPESVDDARVYSAHICAEHSSMLPRLERFLQVGNAQICAARPSHAAHERQCPSALAVVDRVAFSLVRMLAEPRLAHARHRLATDGDCGAFDTSIDACVVGRRYACAPAGTRRWKVVGERP